MKVTYKILILVFACVTVFTSCRKDITELNKNPLGFTTASDGSLFNEVISSLQLGWNEQFYLHNEIFYPETQLAALSSKAWGNYAIGTEEVWNNYYKSLPEIRELERRYNELEDSQEKRHMQAILKVVLAYKTFKVTDMFGDIPYSQAGYGFQDLSLIYPKFDTQEEVYKSLLEELKWADENLNDTIELQEPFITFTSFDQLYNGDVLLWKKFANSLRLRYAIRMADVDLEFAAPIVKEIIEENKEVFDGFGVAGSAVESACLWPGIIGFNNTSIDWSFREHKNLRMGSNIWHLMSANDSTNGSGIFDSRAYYFFESNNAKEWVAYPQIAPSNTPAAGGVPYNSGRDSKDGAALWVKGNTNIYSPFNYFLTRDAFTAPIILMTGVEVHYLKAEAYLRGIGVAQDPSLFSNEYLNGIMASHDWWMEIASKSKTLTYNLKFSDYVADIDTLSSIGIQTHFGPWNATTDEEKLSFLYTQRMIDHFRQPDQAYALARRTGKTMREGEAINHFRLYYPTAELEYNTDNCTEAIHRQGGDSPDVKLWWVSW